MSYILTQKEKTINIKETIMSKQQQQKWKYLLVEDGSIDVDELQNFFDENNQKIKIIIYRQGSIKPEIKVF